MHLADYKALQIKFYHQGQFVTLQGDATLKPAEAHLNHLRRLHNMDAIVEILTLQVIDTRKQVVVTFEVPIHIAPDLALLLQKFHAIFDKPSGLPPQRSQDHCIPLLDSSGPVKVRPYRYPYSQKEQIEIMVEQMLQEGII